MKTLRLLVIAYLVWAVFYSLTFGTFWAINALGFKLNGGPQLVMQLENAGYSIMARQVNANNRAIYTSLSRQGLPYATFVELTYLWGDDAVARAKKKPQQERKDVHFFSFKKFGQDWVVLMGLERVSGINPSSEKDFISHININPKGNNWHPLLELAFLR